MDPEADRQRVEVFLPSRQESQKITYEALKKGIRLQTVLEVADQTARWADEAIDVVKDEYNPPLDCKEGCWYCCCNPEVLVSVPELLSILESIRSKSSDEELAGIASRAKARAAHRKGRTLEELAGEQPQPCPLLVNERCSVYPVRPMVCRGFNSMAISGFPKGHKYHVSLYFTG